MSSKSSISSTTVAKAAQAAKKALDLRLDPTAMAVLPFEPIAKPTKPKGKGKSDQPKGKHAMRYSERVEADTSQPYVPTHAEPEVKADLAKKKYLAGLAAYLHDNGVVPGGQAWAFILDLGPTWADDLGEDDVLAELRGLNAEDGLVHTPVVVESTEQEAEAYDKETLLLNMAEEANALANEHLALAKKHSREAHAHLAIVRQSVEARERFKVLAGVEVAEVVLPDLPVLPEAHETPLDQKALFVADLTDDGVLTPEQAAHAYTLMKDQGRI